MISTIFVFMQVGIIMLSALIHFMIGLKRGAKKTLWYFSINLFLVLFIFIIIGFIPVHEFINEETISHITDKWLNSIDPGITQVVDYAGYKVSVVIFDFVIKIFLFIFFYWVLRLFLMGIIGSKTWKNYKQKNMYITENKQRFLGGFLGMIRGLLSGFIAIMPLLVLINSADSARLQANKDSFSEPVGKIIEANKYNIIKPINEIKLFGTGIADRFFDLAFRTKIDDSNIKWRTEISFYSEAALYAYNLKKENKSFSLNITTLEELEPLFEKLSKTRLINLTTYPIFSYGIKELANNSLDEKIKEKLSNKALDTKLRIDKDIMKLYEMLHKILRIDTLEKWQEYLSNPQIILDLSDQKKKAIFDLASELSDLNIMKMADFAIEAYTYLNVEELINWHETKEMKVTTLESLINKVDTYEGKFLSSMIKDFLIIKEELKEFPKTVYLNNELITLDSLLKGKINYMDINDKDYFEWIDNLGRVVSDSETGVVLLDLAVDYLFTGISKELSKQTENELKKSLFDIKETIKTSKDFKKELNWSIETYKKLIELYGYRKDENETVITALDNILSSYNGSRLFLELTEHLKESELMESMSKNLSSPLINKYFNKEDSISIALQNASKIKNFNIISELDLLKTILIDLYKIDGFSLNNDDATASMIKYFLAYYKKIDNKETLLASNIIYSLVDTELKNNQSIEIPGFVTNKTGDYRGLVDKNEILKLLLTIDNIKIDMTELFSGKLDNKKITEQVLSYAKTEHGMTELLDSGIIYYKIHLLLEDNEKIDIPPFSIENNRTNPYYKLIRKDEILKLRKVTQILEIDDFMNISDDVLKKLFDSNNLEEIIRIDSSFVSYELTNMLKGIESFIIPRSAYTDNTMTQIRSSELLMIIKELKKLNIEIKELSENTDIDYYLKKIKINDFIQIDYQNSPIIRGFITSAVSKTVLDVPFGAFDKEGVFNKEEIKELFKVLDYLNEGNDSISDLKTRINLDTLTILDAKNIINVSNSSVILGLVSNEILKNNQISVLALPNTIYIDQTKQILNKNEIIHLISVILVLDNKESDLFKDAIDKINIDSLNLYRINEIIKIDSTIIRYLISYHLTEGESAMITYHGNDNSALDKNEISELLIELIKENGNDKTIKEVSSHYQNITISGFGQIIYSQSVLLKSIATAQINQNLMSNGDDKSYLSDDILDFNKRHLSRSEFEKIYSVLLVLSNYDYNKKISETLNEITNINLEQTLKILEFKSDIIRKKVSDEFIKKVGKDAIHSASVDDCGFIYESELIEAIRNIYNLTGNIKIIQINSYLERLNISAFRLLLQTNDLLYGISSYMVEKNLSEFISQDAYEKNYVTKNGYLLRLIVKNEVFILLNTIQDIFGDIEINDIANSFDEGSIRISTLNSIDILKSTIIKSLISKMILRSINSAYAIDKRAYETTEPYDLTVSEINKTKEVLNILANSVDHTILELMSLLNKSEIKLSDIEKITEVSSYIIKSYLTGAIQNTYKNLDNVDIYENNTFDLKDRPIKTIKNIEIIKLIDALSVISTKDTYLKDLLAIDIENLRTSDIRLIVSVDSLIINRVITILLENSGMDINKSRAYGLVIPNNEIYNILDFLEALKIGTINELAKLKTNDLISKLTAFRKQDTQGIRFALYIDKDKPENEGLVIIKDYLLKMTRTTNRIMLFNIYMFMK